MNVCIYVIVAVTNISSRGILAAPTNDVSENCDPKTTSSRIEERALCTYTRTVDKDQARLPPEIPTVRCNCLDSLCGNVGDFRCHEVTEMYPVYYPEQRRNVSIEVTTACICVASRSKPASPSLTRILMDVGNDLLA
ncbi:uncharacterized protein LOC119372564 [Rhipicephalus sanguineus]|uniref:uncharacterized protein LOC119372564 n=1 Tax=Rhipicephalus sanguineus TaxID=34632 RepID=UPI001894DAE7|nr:uncharacterized protein LOC119372564 [Rhipicephalus sanguineus]